MRRTPLENWISQKIVCNTGDLNREQIVEYQLKRINETLNTVLEHSSFYRDHLSGYPSSISSLQEFSNLPFTTADNLRTNSTGFVCVSQDAISRIVTLDTSGTTGQSKRCYFTCDDQELTVDFFGVGMSTLVSQGDRVLILLPDRTPGSVGDLLFRGLKRIGVEPFKHGPVTDLDETLQIISRYKINSLVGAPVQILALARLYQLNTKLYPLNLKSILLSTDYLPVTVENIISNIWNCDVFDHYGTTEMGLGGGVQCDAHIGYHLREADLYFEIIDPQTGRVLPVGEMGEVVFTTLTRQGMPLIRYRTGDYSRMLTACCPCGTILKSLDKIVGRIDHNFCVGDRNYFIGDFDEVLFTLPGLINYRLLVSHENKNDHFTFTFFFLSDSNHISRDHLARLLSDNGILIATSNIMLTSNTGYPEELWSLGKRKVQDDRINSELKS
jgi:phenylacetate-CoA ligase